MSYCINPQCQNPQNPDHQELCHSCGSTLLLRNRYRVIKPLGQNLLNRTFLAVDQDKPSQPRCVIQQFLTIETETAQPGVKERFSHAFYHCATKLDSLCKHPRLPDLLASFETEGYRYLVYEYMAGENLAQQLVRGQQFSEKDIWQLLKEVVPVLQLFHEQKLIHGDIKPENIIQNPAPLPNPQRQHHRWILVDFGSVIPLNGIALNAGTHGSAEFTAPEQIRGEPLPSSDLYSLGMICLYLLTEVSPFDLYDIKADTWVWRHYLKQPVSVQLGRILDKLIERDPRVRYHSAATVMRELKSPPAPLETLLQQPKWALAIWSSAAVAVLSILISWRLPVPAPSPSTQSPAPISAATEPQEFEFFNSGAPMRTLAQTSGPVWSVAVSPRGRVVASGSTDGIIQLLNLRTGESLGTLIGHQGPVWSVAISPNGKTLVSGSGDNTIKIWHLCSGLLETTLPGHVGGVYAVTLSPDGKILASAGKDNTIKLWEVSSGRLLVALGDHDEIQSVVFSPNGKFVISGSNHGTLKLWNWKTGQLVNTIAAHTAPVWSVAISPDGKTLASASWDQTVKLWDLNSSGQIGRKPRQTLLGHNDKVQSLAFNSKGNTLASGDFSGTIKLWKLQTGDLLGTLKGHSSWVEVAFDPTSDQLISGSFDDTIKVWKVSQ